MVQANDDAVLVEHFRAAVRDNPMTQVSKGISKKLKITRNFFNRSFRIRPISRIYLVLKNNSSNFKTAILAMETLIKSIEMDDSSATLLSLDKRLKNVQETIYSLPEMKDKMSVKSGTELLVKFTTRMAIDIIQEESDFDKVKKSLIQR